MTFEQKADRAPLGCLVPSVGLVVPNLFDRITKVRLEYQEKVVFNFCGIYCCKVLEDQKIQFNVKERFNYFHFFFKQENNKPKSHNKL